MKIRYAVLAVALAVMVGFAVPASADPVKVDGGWYAFCFGAAVGSPATAGCRSLPEELMAGNTFMWESQVPTLLKVTDAARYGDMFDVYINQTLHKTSIVSTKDGFIHDPDLAFADPGYSKGSWVLDAGNYSVDIYVNNSAYEGGGAYLEVETFRGQVPDAGSSLLLLAEAVVVVHVT
jgi:hypothetical protein